MKTLHTESITKTNDTILQEIEDSKKKGKKKRVSQMDMERPGGFQQPKEGEEQAIINKNYSDRIRMQEALRSAEVAQQYSWAEAEELEAIHKKYLAEEECKNDPNTKIEEFEKPEWYGIDMPKKVLVCEYNTKVQIWKQNMTNRNHILDGLKKLGFTKKVLEALLFDGKIISDKAVLKKLEDAYDKKQLKKDDVDVV